MAIFQGRGQAAERPPAGGLVLGLALFGIFNDRLRSRACSDISQLTGDTMFQVDTRQ